jgi:putative membrane protein
MAMAAAPFDELFVRYEARRSLYEAAFARLGQSRATLPEIRAYAAMLINDHEAYNAALRDLAESKGIAVPSNMATNDQNRLDQLAARRGAAFDSAFIREARRVNGEEMRAFRKEASRTVDPDVRSFVTRFLVVEEKHDAGARALSECNVGSRTPVIKPPRTGGKMPVISPPSASDMPVIPPPAASLEALGRAVGCRPLPGAPRNPGRRADGGANCTSGLTLSGTKGPPGSNRIGKVFRTQATGCGFLTVPGWRARPIRRRPRNCRVEAMILSRNPEFCRSVSVRNYGVIYAVTIRHRMPALHWQKWRKLIIV